MGFVKKAFKSIAKPFEKALGGVKDAIIPEIDTSAQEAAAREQAEVARKSAEQQAQQARWQAEAAANQQASLSQREQLQQSALEQNPIEELDETADIQVGDTGAEARKRRQQFSASGTSSNSPSIRI